MAARQAKADAKAAAKGAAKKAKADKKAAKDAKAAESKAERRARKLRRAQAKVAKLRKEAGFWLARSVRKQNDLNLGRTGGSGRRGKASRRLPSASALGQQRLRLQQA